MIFCRRWIEPPDIDGTCKPSGNFRSNKGLTLIELLVVFSIIAVLSLLLFPSFRALQAGAHTAACQQNLRNIGQGMLHYTQDSNGYFPPHWGGVNDLRWRNSRAFDTNFNGSITWYGFIAPYITDWEGDIMRPMDDVFFCPAADRKHRTGQTYRSTADNALGQSYGYNYFLLTHNYTTATESIIRRRQAIGTPSKLVLVADVPAERGSEPDPGHALPPFMGSFRLYPGTKLSPRHPGKTTQAVFADGHVEAVNTEAFVTPGERFKASNWDPRLAQ